MIITVTLGRNFHRAEKCVLEDTEQIPGTEHNTQGSQGGKEHSDPITGTKHPRQAEKLTHKPIQAGESDTGKRGKDHCHRQQRKFRGKPAKFIQLTCVITFVEHPDDAEERPGREAVIDHLQDPTTDPFDI